MRGLGEPGLLVARCHSPKKRDCYGVWRIQDYVADSWFAILHQKQGASGSRGVLPESTYAVLSLVPPGQAL